MERVKINAPHGIFHLSSLTFQIGGLAQLARAPALHAGGQRFESVILHAREKDRRSQSLQRHKVLLFSLTIFDILYNNSTSKFRISKVNTLE